MGLELWGTTLSLSRTPDGRRLVVCRPVDAPVSAVWDVLTDTRQWPDWGPTVTAVESERRYIQRGSTGRVRVRGGFWLPFEIRDCDPYRWTWRVARLPATGHVTEPRADGSAVGFEIPPLAGGYAPVCARACGRIAALARQSDRTS